MEEKEIIFALKNLKTIKADKGFVKRTKKEIFGQSFSPFLIFPISSLSIAFLLLIVSLLQLPKTVDVVQNQILEFSKGNVPIKKSDQNLAKREELKKTIKSFAQKEQLGERDLKKILEIGKEKKEVERKLGMKVFDEEEDELAKILERHSKILISDIKKRLEGEEPSTTTQMIQSLVAQMEEEFNKGNFQKVIEIYLEYQKENEN